MSGPVSYERWTTASAPAGIDPQVWADAQQVRIERARPWDEQALGRLPHYMGGLLSKSADRKSADREEGLGSQAA